MMFNGTLGGDYIDKLVGDFFYDKFVEQTGQTADSQKVMNKFYEAARIAKERLSIDIKHSVHMEEVIGDFGLDYEFTREEFNKLIRPFTYALFSLLNESMRSAKVNRVDVVEAIGGNSRPQVIHEIIANVTKVNKISHRLNPEDDSLSFSLDQQNLYGSNSQSQDNNIL